MNQFFKKITNWLFPKGENQAIESDPMKYLIIGLGNTGAKYDDTRHNVGFEIVDSLAKEFKTEWKNDNLAYIAEIKHKGRTFVLIKPTTFMNLSGKAARYWMQKHKIPKQNILVILDDLNLPFGKQRLRGKGNDGGHNGLKDIDAMTGGNNYARLRIGIGGDFDKGQQVDFVLGKWSKEETDGLPDILKNATETIKAFGTIGLQFTMNQFNKK
ncbi:MAG: PTH1 family peptidyl-tRNA hydrolase [Paraglaciecola sp.]|jgi:PTH1 family peptidyl-tRNA hydrolase